MKSGDGNNKFFFNQVKMNWNQNKVLSILNSKGDLVHGHSNVANVAVDYFKEALGSSQARDIPLDLSTISCPQLSDMFASLLVQPFSREDIWNIIKHMKKGKAPGPDGFNVEFFIACWDIVGDNFYDAIMDFFESSQLHRGLNSTSIALIPKVPTPSRMSDSGPFPYVLWHTNAFRSC